MRHELKIWPGFIDAVQSGNKTFEIRRADRAFTLGDTLVLREWSPNTEKYTGRQCEVLITYILGGGEFGLHKGYVVLGIDARRRDQTRLDDADKLLREGLEALEGDEPDTILINDWAEDVRTYFTIHNEQP